MRVLQQWRHLSRRFVRFPTMSLWMAIPCSIPCDTSQKAMEDESCYPGAKRMARLKGKIVLPANMILTCVTRQRFPDA